MRFMMIVKASKDSEAGIMPGEELLAAMTKYNEELAEERRHSTMSAIFPGLSEPTHG